MSTVLLQSHGAFHVDAEVAACLQSKYSTNLLIKSGDATSSVSDIGLAHVDGAWVPNGPYIATVGASAVTLTEVFRVYRDESQAFTTGSVKTVDDRFVALTGNFPGMNTVSIPVPSRLYADVADPRPLEGVRVAVKDIYDMAGLRTGCGNQAYFLFYPEREVNSFPVQRLLEHGAVLVGKTKTCKFPLSPPSSLTFADIASTLFQRALPTASLLRPTLSARWEASTRVVRLRQPSTGGCFRSLTTDPFPCLTPQATAGRSRPPRRSAPARPLPRTTGSTSRSAATQAARSAGPPLSRASSASGPRTMPSL